MEFQEAMLQINALNRQQQENSAGLYIPYIYKQYQEQRDRNGLLSKLQPLKSQISHPQCKHCIQHLNTIIQTQNEIQNLIDVKFQNQKLSTKLIEAKTTIASFKHSNTILTTTLSTLQKTYNTLKQTSQKQLQDVISSVKQQNNDYESAAILQLNNIIKQLKTDVLDRENDLKECKLEMKEIQIQQQLDRRLQGFWGSESELLEENSRLRKVAKELERDNLELANLVLTGKVQ